MKKKLGFYSSVEYRATVFLNTENCLENVDVVLSPYPVYSEERYLP